MKNAIIHWDKKIFNGESKLLPNKNQLYTQITNNDEASWTLVLKFDNTPRNQGYKSKCQVSFMSNKAPDEILKNGFKFDVMDGGTQIGKGEIIIEKTISSDEILLKLDIIEDEKRQLKEYIKSINPNTLDYSLNNLEKLIKYSSDYPFLFSFVLKINKNIALEYLEKFYLKIPIESNSVFHSYLPLFLFNIQQEIGKNDFINYINNLKKNITEHEIVKSALEEIL